MKKFAALFSLVFFALTVLCSEEYHRLYHHFQDTLHSHSVDCLWTGTQQKTHADFGSSKSPQWEEAHCEILQGLKNIPAGFNHNPNLFLQAHSFFITSENPRPFDSALNLAAPCLYSSSSRGPPAI